MCWKTPSSRKKTLSLGKILQKFYNKQESRNPGLLGSLELTAVPSFLQGKHCTFFKENVPFQMMKYTHIYKLTHTHTLCTHRHGHIHLQTSKSKPLLQLCFHILLPSIMTGCLLRSWTRHTNLYHKINMQCNINNTEIWAHIPNTLRTTSNKWKFSSSKSMDILAQEPSLQCTGKQ